MRTRKDKQKVPTPWPFGRQRKTGQSLLGFLYRIVIIKKCGGPRDHTQRGEDIIENL